LYEALPVINQYVQRDEPLGALGIVRTVVTDEAGCDLDEQSPGEGDKVEPGKPTVRCAQDRGEVALNRGRKDFLAKPGMRITRNEWIEGTTPLHMSRSVELS
jgi:hypothetical protein